MVTREKAPPVSIDPRLLRSDPRVPPRETVVTRYLLERHERERPDAVFAVFPGGLSWTWRETADAARRAASGLAATGVRQGDRVLSWLPNGPDALRVWFGANWLGATYVPINLAYRGGLLTHVIENSQAKIMVCHADLAPRLKEIAPPARLRKIIPVGGDTDLPDCLRALTHDALVREIDDRALELTAPIEPWHEQSIIYTSGTTGPSKGVLSSYCHSATTAVTCFFEDKPVDQTFRYMLTLPLFHAGGTLGVTSALLMGTSVAVVDRFDTATFFDLARETRSTCCTLLGAMATFLLKQSPSAGDRDHPLSFVYLIPLTDQVEALRARFGFDIYTVFNMTEISAPIISGPNPTLAGSCGRVRAGAEVRLVDENDVEVAPGEVGELIVRTSRPWAMTHGYNGMPEATAGAWRNGWFHTGDAFRRAQGGEFVFVDRVKDAIRRRGENVSSFEVERECLAHPAVREAAAVAVPSEYGEDEILVAVAPVDGASIDPAELVEFLRPRMAHFMVPRFIRVLSELPKTPTEKVQKAQLRKEGVAADAWDRERHGIRIKAERVG